MLTEAFVSKPRATKQRSFFKHRKEMSYTRVEYDVVLQAPRLDLPDSAAVVVPFQNARSWAYYEQNLSRRQSFEGMAPDSTARSGSYARSDREYTASKITPLKLKTMVGTRTVDGFVTVLTQSGLNATPTFGSRTGAQAADETGTVSTPTPQSVPKVRQSCDSMTGAWADDDSGPAFMPSVEPDSDYTLAIETRSGPPTADEHDPTRPMQADAAAQTETMVPAAIRNLEIAVQVQARVDRSAMDALRRERDTAVQRERSVAHDKERAISINKNSANEVETLRKENDALRVKTREMQRQLEKAREGEKRAQEACREAVEREKAALAELDEAELRQEQSQQALATAIMSAVKDNTQPKSKKRRLDGDEIVETPGLPDNAHSPRVVVRVEFSHMFSNQRFRYVCCSVREQLGGKMVLEWIETKPVLARCLIAENCFALLRRRFRGKVLDSGTEAWAAIVANMF